MTPDMTSTGGAAWVERARTIERADYSISSEDDDDVLRRGSTQSRHAKQSVYSCSVPRSPEQRAEQFCQRTSRTKERLFADAHARAHSAAAAAHRTPHSPTDAPMATSSGGAPHRLMCTCSSCLSRSLRRTRDVGLLQHNSLALQSPSLPLPRAHAGGWGDVSRGEWGGRGGGGRTTSGWELDSVADSDAWHVPAYLVTDLTRDSHVRQRTCDTFDTNVQWHTYTPRVAQAHAATTRPRSAPAMPNLLLHNMPSPQRSPYLYKQLHRLGRQGWGTGEEEEEQYQVPHTPQQQTASVRKHGPSGIMTAPAYSTHRHRDVLGKVQQYLPRRSKLAHSAREDALSEASEEAIIDKSPLRRHLLSPSSAHRPPPPPPAAPRRPPQTSPTRSGNRGYEHLYSYPATGIDDGHGQAGGPGHTRTPSPSRRPQHDVSSRRLGSEDAGRMRVQVTALSPPMSTLQLHTRLRQSQLRATTLRQALQQADEVAAKLEAAARAHALQNKQGVGRGRPGNNYLFDSYTRSTYGR